MYINKLLFAHTPIELECMACVICMCVNIYIYVCGVCGVYVSCVPACLGVKMSVTINSLKATNILCLRVIDEIYEYDHMQLRCANKARKMVK